MRIRAPKTTALIFSSGKIVLTGAKKRQQIYEAYTKIRSILAQHKNEEVRPVQPSYVTYHKQGSASRRA